MFNDLQYKIIQAPMAGSIINPYIVASVCNNGMLGSIPSGYLNITDLAKFIRDVKDLTEKPFIVNIFIDKLHLSSEILFKSQMLCNVEKQICPNLSNQFTYPASIHISEYVELLIKEQVKFVSSTFGFFDCDTVERLHSHNIKILATVTNIEEAKFCLINGADGLILQGIEAGGHQGNFLNTELSNISTDKLLLQVRTLFPRVPLVIAGGIGLNQIQWYLENGADCVQLGTIFMLSEEGNLPNYIKEFIVNNKITKVTKYITGQYARGIENKLMSFLESDNQYTFPVQHYATSELRKYARANNLPEYMSLWAGSNQDNFQINKLSDLIEQLKEYSLPRIILESTRLFFKVWRKDMLPFAHQLWGNHKVSQYISSCGYFDENQIIQKLEIEIKHQQHHNVQYWSLYNRDNKFIGCCGLRPKNIELAIYEIGIHLLPEYWSCGFASEAMHAVINYARSCKYIKLFAGHHPQNTASRNLLNKLGFTFVYDEHYEPTGLMHPSYELVL